jgi:N-acetylneuraminic acid mutarotase
MSLQLRSPTTWRALRVPFGLGLACAVAAAGCGSQQDPTAPLAEVHDPVLAAVANRWVKRADLGNIQRYGHAIGVVPNAAGRSVLYVIGGAQYGNQPSGPTGLATRKVHAYNTATNDWFARAPLPLDLYRSNGAGVIDGKIYVSGGRQSGDKRYVRGLFVYDPATNAWTRKAYMPTETWGGMTAVLNGQLYVLTCEGEQDCDQFWNQALYRYDPATDHWTFLSVTPVDLGFPMGGFIGGKLYATGGPEGALLAWDPATNQWQIRTGLPRRRWNGAGVTVGGKLYIVGGFEGERTGPGTLVRKTSVYQPSTDTWQEAALMPTARSDFAAGRVVVNGKARIQAVGGARPGNNVQYIP